MIFDMTFVVSKSYHSQFVIRDEKTNCELLVLTLEEVEVEIPGK